MLLVMALIGTWMTFGGGAPFSPGPLNAVGDDQPLGDIRNHSETGGNCAACHAAPWDRLQMSDRCKTCHTDLIEDPENFHNIMLTEAKARGTCLFCHTDHNGPQALLTKANLHGFDHNLLGFSLRAHQKNRDGTTFACSDCHLQGYIQKTGSVCLDCHTRLDAVFSQAHQSNFGPGCLDCHDGKETYGKSFDHQQTAFPLNGKHASLECLVCHTGARSMTDLKNKPQACFSCHAKNDNHQGSFGDDCGQCHSEEGWIPAKFDHSLAAFKLTGKHTNVDCTACHIDHQFQGTPQDCYTCHSKDDLHLGNLGHLCDQCHTPAGWSPVNFDHSKASFPLTGKHIDVACDKCHSTFQFKDTPQVCFYCHNKDDAHQGELGISCIECHTTAGWRPANFDHSKATFPLIGKHADLACTACHQDLLFKKTSADCFACHAKDDAHQGQLGSSCGRCHTPAGWSPSTFDHSKTAFPLVGKHSTLECKDCHQDLLFTNTSSSCYACHARDDAHNGQFGQDCGACHSPAGWLPANFDHSKSGFPLTGAHARLSCRACHANSRFAGTPAACSACHAEPAYHRGSFGLNCASCHSTSSWIPASFNGSHTFPLNHGGAGSCRTCHPDSLNSYTCFNCHDQGEMQSKHQEHGITDIGNCVSCHPTGQKEDGGGGGGED